MHQMSPVARAEALAAAEASAAADAAAATDRVPDAAAQKAVGQRN